MQSKSAAAFQSTWVKAARTKRVFVFLSRDEFVAISVHVFPGLHCSAMNDVNMWCVVVVVVVVVVWCAHAKVAVVAHDVPIRLQLCDQGCDGCPCPRASPDTSA